MSVTLGIGHGECNEDCPCKTRTSNLSIWTCAIEGDKGMMERRIREKPSLVRLSDPYGYIPLHYAAQRGHIEIVELLLQNGSVIDGLSPPDGCGATPLHRCAYNGHVKVCEILLSAGAEIDARDMSFRDNRTPLMKAASQGHQLVMNLLIKHGANVDLVDSQGLSYLQILNQRTLDELQSEKLRQISREEETSTSTSAPSLPPVSSGIVCSQCQKETYAVMSTKGRIICLQCGKQRISQY